MQSEKNYIFNGIECITVKKFFSRINSVYLIESINEAGRKYILKDFEDNKDRLKAEKAGMEIFKELSPELIYSDDRYLIHEYIPGETFLSYYEEAELTGHDFSDQIKNLLKFLKSMYSIAPGYILGDINFNNFIINSTNSIGKIMFIDHENVRTGEIEEDLGRIVAFALTYNPILTEWKYGFSLKFIDNAINTFNAEKAKVLLYLEKELEAMNGRRRMKIDISEVLKKVG